MIRLAENGMIHLSNCEWMDLREGGQFSDRVQGGFWDDYTGELEEGFISVDDMNEVLSKMHVGNGIKSIQLKQDGKVAKLLLDFN